MKHKLPRPRYVVREQRRIVERHRFYSAARRAAERISHGDRQVVVELSGVILSAWIGGRELLQSR